MLEHSSSTLCSCATLVVLVKEREGEEEERLEASVIERNRGGEIGGPPLNINVEKSQTVCQALTVNRYPTLQLSSWQKLSGTVTVQFAKHLTVDGEWRTVGEHWARPSAICQPVLAGYFNITG